jgi:hypothetical protein
LLTYARENGHIPNMRPVKPFMLVIARDTTHAGQLLALLESEAFYEGRYQGKVIQVDSSRTGAEEEEMITRLLAVESVDEPTEILIHVNMLKEGWDVTNLYTIVPLRAANARTLIEQSIGRGLRLPYGKRTGVASVDRLNIVAHDKFQEIVDEANRGDSPIRLKQVILDAPSADDKKVSVQVESGAAARLGLTEAPAVITGASATDSGAEVPAPKPVFTTEAEKQAVSFRQPCMKSLAASGSVGGSSMPIRSPADALIPSPCRPATGRHRGRSSRVAEHPRAWRPHSGRPVVASNRASRAVRRGPGGGRAEARLHQPEAPPGRHRQQSGRARTEYAAARGLRRTQPRPAARPTGLRPDPLGPTRARAAHRVGASGKQ